MPRPTLFTPETQAKIIAAIAGGNYYEPACRASGVAYDTFRKWVQQGQADSDAGLDTAYSVFLLQVQAAEAEAELALVAQWQGQAPSDWKATRDLLARRHPERWADQRRLQIDGGHAPTVNVQVLAVSDLGGLAQLLAPPPSPPATLIEGQIVVNEQP